MLPSSGLPQPQPLEILRAEGQLLDRDGLALAKLVAVDLPLDVVSVHQAALVGAVGTLLEKLEQRVARLIVLEHVTDREEERLAYRAFRIADRLHYDVKSCAPPHTGELLADLLSQLLEEYQ